MLDDFKLLDDAPKSETESKDIDTNFTGDKRSMDEIFKSLLPDSLYMSHYDLHNAYPHHSAEDWRRYLKENDKFIMRETAVLTEVEARRGLKVLGAGVAKASDVAAIRQLLERSEQINQQTKDKMTYITMFMPDPNQLLQEGEEHVESTE